MWIESLRLEGFGLYRNVEFEFRPGALNLLVDRNEQGKTTLLQALAALLYGTHEVKGGRRHGLNVEDLYRPWDGGSYKISGRVHAGDSTLDIERDLKQREVRILEDGRDVTDAYRTGKSDVPLGSRLTGGLGREMFLKTLCVTHAGLQGGKLEVLAEPVEQALSSQSGETRTAEEALQVLRGALDQLGADIVPVDGARQADRTVGRLEAQLRDLEAQDSRLRERRRRIEEERARRLAGPGDPERLAAETARLEYLLLRANQTRWERDRKEMDKLGEQIREWEADLERSSSALDADVSQRGRDALANALTLMSQGQTDLKELEGRIRELDKEISCGLDRLEREGIPVSEREAGRPEVLLQAEEDRAFRSVQLAGAWRSPWFLTALAGTLAGAGMLLAPLTRLAGGILLGAAVAGGVAALVRCRRASRRWLRELERIHRLRPVVEELSLQRRRREELETSRSREEEGIRSHRERALGILAASGLDKGEDDPDAWLRAYGDLLEARLHARRIHEEHLPQARERLARLEEEDPNERLAGLASQRAEALEEHPEWKDLEPDRPLRELEEECATMERRLQEAREAESDFQRETAAEEAELRQAFQELSLDLPRVRRDLARARRFRDEVSLALEELEAISRDSFRLWSRELDPRVKALAGELLPDLESFRFKSDLNFDLVLHGGRHITDADLPSLSRGARAQLLLALRLAIADYLSASVPDGRLPLFLDDPFVHFDDDRQLRAMRLLVQRAGAGAQIFLFTCHESRQRRVREQLGEELENCLHQVTAGGGKDMQEAQG